MSGAQFTPASWTASVEARPLPASGHWYVVLDSEENGLGEFYGDDHEANVANLRLACAAPDMFEALKEALAGLLDLPQLALGFAEKPTSDRLALQPQRDVLVEKIGAALAKAVQS